MDKSIQERASFNRIRYANCWEDADILVEALSPGVNDCCLSIASAGDNSLALLTQKPEMVLAVDINPGQIACTEIKKACFKYCSYEEMIAFLGIASVNHSVKFRVDIYNRLKEHISDESRSFWDNNRGSIESGIIFSGKFENYFKMFRTKILPFIHRKKVITELLSQHSKEQRRGFYNRIWNNMRWRLLFRIFFGRAVMGRAGRDPEFFRFVEGPVAKRIFKRAEYGLTEISTHDNPYLHFIVNGTFGSFMPMYARPENFNAIRESIDSLELFKGTTESAGKRYGRLFDCFNLSDIFEYMPQQLFCETAADILNHSRTGARIVYWNMLVPRSVSEQFPGRAAAQEKAAEDLFLRDKCFFYSRFRIDKVVK